MATMSRRVQILVDEPRYEILERESRRTGRSVADLIRESVDRVYGADRARRHAALDGMFAEAPVPVEDWAEMKQELHAEGPRLDARDAMHAATALNHGIDAIVSPDRAFGDVRGLRRLDPTDAAAQLPA